jgi:hypothetical protein
VQSEKKKNNFSELGVLCAFAGINLNPHTNPQPNRAIENTMLALTGGLVLT